MRSTWQERRRVFTYPASQLKWIRGATEDTAERLLFGFTTVELVNECGDVKFVVTNGNQK